MRLSVLSVAGIILLFVVMCHAQEPLDFTVELTTVRSGHNPDTSWTQAFVGVIQREPPVLVVTMSRHINTGVDNYGDLYECRSEDRGESWTPPQVITPLRRSKSGIGVEEVLSDVYLGWHAKSQILLGTGKLFIYNIKSTERDREMGRRAAYTVWRPGDGVWSSASLFEFPENDHSGAPIINPSLGCIQRYDLADGTILLPAYYERTVNPGGEHEKNVSTVVRCSFDGQTLRYIEHGSEHAVSSGRGLAEPSIAFYKGKYYLTLRSNHSAHVAQSDDGLRFTGPVEWRFDDGEVLGSYNTQQHWVSHSDGLFLIYTRRGANNDHIRRHRAPLFIGCVDPERLCVIRESERVVIPERGARLGNFGVTHLDAHTTLVSVAERMQEDSQDRGADNRVFVAKIHWNHPNEYFVR
jgi:hypothetical protein